LDKIHRKSAISILIAIMFLIASLAIGSVNAYAIELEGAETGLKVNTSGVLVSTDNLAPGDTKTSSMTISLDSDSSVKDNTLPVWMRAEVIESIPGKSFEGKKGNLEDKLEFTITHENGEMLYKGLANGLGKTIVLGRIAKGESFDINISVHLPGAATGNEYQAASIKVKWKVITMYSPGPSPTPTEPSPTPTEPSPTPTEPSPTPVDPSPTPVVPSPTPIEPSPTPVDPSPTPVVPSPTPFDPTPTPTDGTIRDFEDEPVPEGSPEPEIEIIEEEFIPAGLPKTGELPPILFYGLGAGIVYAGIKLNKKKKN
jgi:hypothetical protein